VTIHRKHVTIHRGATRLEKDSRMSVRTSVDFCKTTKSNMPPKVESPNIYHQRLIETANLKQTLIAYRRARHACIVCDVFLGSDQTVSVVVDAGNGNPILMCSSCILWNKKDTGGWGSNKRQWEAAPNNDES